LDEPSCVDGVVVDGADGVVELPPLPPLSLPMFGQSPWLFDPPLAANIECGPSYDAAGVLDELVPLDGEPLPAAIATVAHTAAATSTAATANQKLGRVDLVSLMRYLLSRVGVVKLTGAG
jgi:hypothetical protein